MANGSLNYRACDVYYKEIRYSLDHPTDDKNCCHRMQPPEVENPESAHILIGR